MNWSDGGELGRCFLFVKKQDLVLEWTEANEYCKERGGFLTDVLNQDTFDFLSIHMLDGGGWRWIGGSNIDNVSSKTNSYHFLANTEKCFLIGWEICMGK